MSRITPRVQHSANPNHDIMPMTAYGMITEDGTKPLMKFTGEVYYRPATNDYVFPFVWGDGTSTDEKFESICQNVFPEDANVELNWFIAMSIKWVLVRPRYDAQGAALQWWDDDRKLNLERCREVYRDFGWQRTSEDNPPHVFPQVVPITMGVVQDGELTYFSTVSLHRDILLADVVYYPENLMHSFDPRGEHTADGPSITIGMKPAEADIIRYTGGLFLVPVAVEYHFTIAMDDPVIAYKLMVPSYLQIEGRNAIDIYATYDDAVKGQRKCFEREILEWQGRRLTDLQKLQQK